LVYWKTLKQSPYVGFFFYRTIWKKIRIFTRNNSVLGKEVRYLFKRYNLNCLNDDTMILTRLKENIDRGFNQFKEHQSKINFLLMMICLLFMVTTFLKKEKEDLVDENRYLREIIMRDEIKMLNTDVFMYRLKIKRDSAKMQQMYNIMLQQKAALENKK